MYQICELTDRNFTESGLSIRNFLEKATRHCPWSGTLWAQYIIAAEIAKMPFPEIEDIKHRATSSGILVSDSQCYFFLPCTVPGPPGLLEL